MNARNLLLLAFAMTAASAASAEAPFFNAEKFDRRLSRIVEGKGATDPLVGAAIAVMVGDRLVYAGAAGCAAFDAEGKTCVRDLSPTSKMRVASISKMALAISLLTLVEDGRLDLDRDVSDYLGWRLRNPAFPDAPVTARQLLSHMSSLTDPEEYWIAAPGDFTAFISEQVALFDRARPPGAWFRYANINYSVLAAIIEKVSGERFDRFMSRALFEPAGLDIGYNWSGVSASARAAGAGLYRREGERFAPLADPPAVLADTLPYFLAEEGVDRRAYLKSYQPGENPTLFSPQGGLRASVVDLAKLARLLKAHPAMISPVWRYDAEAPNGDTQDGLFAAFGLGVQEIAGNAKLSPETILIGHAGEAYGLYGGAWMIEGGESGAAGDELTIAFVATGVDEIPEKGAHSSFNLVEERLLRLALDAAKAGVEPQPFDEKADAMRDVDLAIAASKTSGKRPLLVLGGNWCHDSRGIAKKFQTTPLSRLIEDGFELVWVDVGHKDRNLDVAERFGVEKLIGTPTILILSPDGALLNADTVHDWRTADSRSIEEALDYFGAFSQSKK